MLYPWAGGDDTCATQPLITVSNIQLHNVTTHGGIFPPGVIRGNSTHPMTDFVWDNVHSRGWWKLFGLGFITEFTEGTVTDSKPVPEFMNLPPSEEEESHCPLKKLFKHLVKMVEHAWEFLWPANWFELPAFDMLPDNRPTRDGWDQKPWARDHHQGHHQDHDQMPFENPFAIPFGPQDEYESITITIIIQRLNALFFSE